MVYFPLFFSIYLHLVSFGLVVLVVKIRRYHHTLNIYSGESSWLRHEAMHRFLRLQKAITSHMWLFTEAHRGVMWSVEAILGPMWLNKKNGWALLQGTNWCLRTYLFFCITAVILTEKHQGVSCDDWS